MESQFFEASVQNRVEEVKTLLLAHPNLKVNWRNPFQWTALHTICAFGHRKIVKALLAHPAINVNVLTLNRSTPFSFACEFGQLPVVQIMMKDLRVEIAWADDEGCTPLWFASRNGHLDVVEWLIASGRDLGDLAAEGKGGEDRGYSAAEIARVSEHERVAELLERFMTNPAQTRHEVQVELGLSEAMIAGLFALVIFFCDGLLQLDQEWQDSTAARFFSIASKLPMELQMVLCHRVFGSMKQNILQRDSEAAFKSVAGVLTEQEE